jgi:hypothetical protein
LNFYSDKFSISELESYAFAEKSDFEKIFNSFEVKYDDFKGKIRNNLIKLGREKGNKFKKSFILLFN